MIQFKRESIPNSRIFNIIHYSRKKGGTTMGGVAGYGTFGNGFILLVVLFVLLIIVGNSYPIAGAY
jgi:uncharacterized protein (TIGR01732 family)